MNYVNFIRLMLIRWECLWTLKNAFLAIKNRCKKNSRFLEILQFFKKILKFPLTFKGLPLQQKILWKVSLTMWVKNY